MVATSSEASIEKLAISILKDTEGGNDATTVNIVEMIDNITTNVSYTRSSRQDVSATASSDNTVVAKINLASKTGTQAGEKEQLKILKKGYNCKTTKISQVGRTCCNLA